jgi:hypothetical protein
MMPDSQEDRPRRTIVGGRPRKHRRVGAGIPRGIEVLIKKASLDSAFCRLLLDQRAAAAREIGLDLTPAETAILGSVPDAQLQATIANTRVPDAQRRAFLGMLGAAMLAAVVAGCTPPTPEATDTPPIIEVEKGIRPDEIERTRQVQRTPTRTPRATPTLKATPTPEATATSTPNVITGTRPEPEPTLPPPVVRGTRPDPP